MVNEDFKEELKIEKYALDVECLDQPRRYAKWAGLYIEATTEVEKLRQQIKLVKAKAMVDIRKFPDKYGIEKATESTITLLVDAHGDVQKLRDLCIEAEYREGILKTAMESFRDRKEQLSNLIHLYLSGYWAEPKVKGEDMGKLGEKGVESHKRLLTKRLKNGS